MILDWSVATMSILRKRTPPTPYATPAIAASAPPTAATPWQVALSEDGAAGTGAWTTFPTERLVLIEKPEDSAQPVEAEGVSILPEQRVRAGVISHSTKRSQFFLPLFCMRVKNQCAGRCGDHAVVALAGFALGICQILERYFIRRLHEIFAATCPKSTGHCGRNVTKHSRLLQAVAQASQI